LALRPALMSFQNASHWAEKPHWALTRALMVVNRAQWAPNGRPKSKAGPNLRRCRINSKTTQTTPLSNTSITLNINTNAPTTSSTTSTTHTCINGNMEQNNNQLLIPEAAVTGSGKTTPSATSSPPPSEVLAEYQDGTTYLLLHRNHCISSSKQLCKGRGTSPSNLTRLESISEVPTNEFGVLEMRQFITNNRTRINVSQKSSKKVICDDIAEACLWKRTQSCWHHQYN
jgi:hypothetical protein